MRSDLRTPAQKNHRIVQTLAVSAMMAALASVLMFLELPLPLFPSFLKLDFSDFPALIAAFTCGPAAGVAVEIVKNLIHFLAGSRTAGVGELANAIVGCALVVPAGLIYRRRRTFAGALLGLAVGTLAMGLIGGLVNFFLLIPFYSHQIPMDKIIEMGAKIIPAINSKFKLVLYSIVPFNLLKGVLISAVTLLLYKHISRLLKIMKLR